MGRIVEVLFFSNNTTETSAIIFDEWFNSALVGREILRCINSNNFFSRNHIQFVDSSIASTLLKDDMKRLSHL